MSFIENRRKKLMMMANSSLTAAKKAKNDEFYTQMTDIEKELYYYRPHFKDAKVFLNCDDPEYSNFWKYFMLNFDELGLKKLTSTHYDEFESTYKLELFRSDDDIVLTSSSQYVASEEFPNRIVKTSLIGNGDFRSQECIDILEDSDIVVTNPPFSLFREYIAQLMEHDKKFVILGNKNEKCFDL